jgi:nitronate monooxygenase
VTRPAGAEVNIAGGGANAKAWRDIWSAGQGIGAVKKVATTKAYVDWLAGDYAAARRAMRIAP